MDKNEGELFLIINAKYTLLIQETEREGSQVTGLLLYVYLAISSISAYIWNESYLFNLAE